MLTITAEALDDEMKRRIRIHRRSRPAAWDTLEAPRELVSVLQPRLAHYDIFLLDCITMWVSNLLLEMKGLPRSRAPHHGGGPAVARLDARLRCRLDSGQQRGRLGHSSSLTPGQGVPRCSGTGQPDDRRPLQPGTPDGGRAGIRSTAPSRVTRTVDAPDPAADDPGAPHATYETGLLESSRHWNVAPPFHDKGSENNPFRGKKHLEDRE